MTYSEIQLLEDLEAMGQLIAAQDNAGCYALECKAPQTGQELQDVWHDHWNVEPPESILGPLTDAQRVAYVGAAYDSLFARLSDHCTKQRNQASLLKLCPPTGIARLWPDADPETDEFNCAQKMVRDGYTVLCDGEVYVHR